MRVIKFFFLIFIVVQSASAQRGDSLLLNETKLSRPLNVHRNQLRISGAHLLALSSTQFIGSDKMPSNETGRTRTFSSIDLDVKYGVTEYIQARLAMNRTAEIITEPAYFDGFGTEYYIFNSSQQKIGWQDPEFWIDYRLPFMGKRTDIVFNIGASLPAMKSGTERPSLRIAPSDIVFGGGMDFQRISTVEFFNAGNGVSRLGYGVQVKHRFKYLAINLQSTYYLPLSTQSVDRWLLSNNGSDFISESYKRQLADQLILVAGIERQIRPWLNISVGGVFIRSQHGWNEVTGEKLLIPTSTLTQASLSYEIIASKKLWIGQSLNLTIEGADVWAPVLLNTSVKYNLFL